VLYRLVGRAEARIDGILLESARQWGIDAAVRYHRLVLAACATVADNPTLPGSREVPSVPGVRTYHLRLARRLVPGELRVGRPRHLLVYRVASDNIVEILSVIHDRMLLPRAARRAQQDANC
jgi:toxin ParE1/3/4